MAIIPIPERGQPLDVTYISAMANAINDVTKLTSGSVSNNVSVTIPNTGAVETKKINDVRISALYQNVVNGGTKSAGEELTFPIRYPFEFKYPPIITATLVNMTGTPAGKNVTMVLSDITASSAQGIVRFNATGEISIGVNLIIIGIPNNA